MHHDHSAPRAGPDRSSLLALSYVNRLEDVQLHERVAGRTPATRSDIYKFGHDFHVVHMDEEKRYVSGMSTSRLA